PLRSRQARRSVGDRSTARIGEERSDGFLRPSMVAGPRMECTYSVLCTNYGPRRRTFAKRVRAMLNSPPSGYQSFCEKMWAECCYEIVARTACRSHDRRPLKLISILWRSVLSLPIPDYAMIGDC